MEDLRRFVTVLARLFPDQSEAPPLLGRARAVLRTFEGEAIEEVARSARFPRYHLGNWVEAVQEQGLYGWLGKPEPDKRKLERARQGIAQMLLGALAEERFEGLAREVLGREFRLEDERVSRTDTDYRLLDASGRPICRLNIKFHGTLFRESKEYVDLEPAECFALATYKINAALKRQEEERLPYVFLVISVPGAPRAVIEASVPDDLAWITAITNRNVEEAVAGGLLREPWAEAVRAQVRQSEFRVFSARRAYRLLQQHLFERVHALRLRAFNRLFRGAEINMHLSLTGEMVSFTEFLSVLQQTGVQGLSVRLERGEI